MTGTTHTRVESLGTDRLLFTVRVETVKYTSGDVSVCVNKRSESMGGMKDDTIPRVGDLPFLPDGEVCVVVRIKDRVIRTTRKVP